MTTGTCPIWGTFASHRDKTGDGTKVYSSRAGGAYFVSEFAEAVLNSNNTSDKVKLTSWLVEQRRGGIGCPEISSWTLDEVFDRDTPSVQKRADKLLVFIVCRSSVIGSSFAVSRQILDTGIISWIPSPVFENLLAHSDSVGPEEVDYLLGYLVEQNWMKRTVHHAGQLSEGPHSGHQDYSEYVVTPGGHARIDELDQRGSNSNQAFVAMWFDDSIRDAYTKGIAPAIRDAGYEPIRIDEKDHNDKIDDRIIAEIRRSRFVVADFTHGETGVRGGVYYEAGFAHGLNIPVIFTCQEDAISNVHFDTRQYNHIVWKDAKDLCVRLEQRISATIGNGPLRKSK
jgi:hypothetical protein